MYKRGMMVTPYWEDNYAKIYCGDNREVLKQLPEVSVDCVMTSPPYYGLRAYKCEPVVWDGDENCKHEWGSEKPIITGRHDADYHQRRNIDGTERPERREDIPLLGLRATPTTTGQFCLLCGAWRGVLGMEPTPQLYIQHLAGVFDLVRRVLKPTGTMFINISDSYCGGIGNRTNRRHMSNSDQDLPLEYSPLRDLDSVPAKSLIGIPGRFQIAMIDRGWICRNDIIWWKRSCMPESVSDRFTRDFEHIFMFSANPTYYFEQQFDAISEGSHYGGTYAQDTDSYNHQGNIGNKGMVIKKPALGRNKRTVWDITSGGGTKFKHYASYPVKLCETPIKAGCPEYICPKCGKVRERMYEAGELEREQSFLGYSDCLCSPPTPLEQCVPGVVLDLFGGTGTTGYAAKQLGRKSILIDVSPEYCDMSIKRLKTLPGVQRGMV